MIGGPDKRGGIGGPDTEGFIGKKGKYVMGSSLHTTLVHGFTHYPTTTSTTTTTRTTTTSTTTTTAP